MSWALLPVAVPRQLWRNGCDCHSCVYKTSKLQCTLAWRLTEIQEVENVFGDLLRSVLEAFYEVLLLSVRMAGEVNSGRKCGIAGLNITFQVVTTDFSSNVGSFFTCPVFILITSSFVTYKPWWWGCTYQVDIGGNHSVTSVKHVLRNPGCKGFMLCQT